MPSKLSAPCAQFLQIPMWFTCVWVAASNKALWLTAACDFVLKYISPGQYWASFLLPTSHKCYLIVQQLPDALAKERTRRNIWSSRYQSPFPRHCSLSLLPFTLMLPQSFAFSTVEQFTYFICIFWLREMLFSSRSMHSLQHPTKERPEKMRSKWQIQEGKARGREGPVCILDRTRLPNWPTMNFLPCQRREFSLACSLALVSSNRMLPAAASPSFCSSLEVSLVDAQFQGITYWGFF